MAVALDIGAGAEDNRYIIQRRRPVARLIELSSGERDALGAVARFGKAEIDRLVVREFGRQDHVHQPALSGAVDGGDSGHGDFRPVLWIE